MDCKIELKSLVRVELWSMSDNMPNLPLKLPPTIEHTQCKINAALLRVISEVIVFEGCSTIHADIFNCFIRVIRVSIQCGIKFHQEYSCGYL